MKINLSTVLTVELTDADLSQAIFRRAREMAGSPDDAGCDWYTDDHGNTYVAGDYDWQVSSDPTVAAMIDLYHTLSGSPARQFKMPDQAQSSLGMGA